MSGTIGLTPAGQMLDFIMIDLDTKERRRITKFITHVSKVAKDLRSTTIDADSKNAVLNIVRDHYIDLAGDTFDYLDEICGAKMRNMIVSLIESYTCAVFKQSFVPDTRTQKALARKRMAAAAAAAAAPGTTN